VLTTRHIELEGSVSLPDLNLTGSVDSIQLVAYVQEAVLWASLRYQRNIRQDELDDLSQQIILKLIEDDCRRLRLFNQNFAFKTWLQAVVNHHVYKRLCRRKSAGISDEVDQGSLVYSPPQDQEIYAAEQRELLFRALCALSEQERLLYNLCFVAEQDTQKIASAFKINVKRVYKRKETLVLKLTKLVQNLQAR